MRCYVAPSFNLVGVLEGSFNDRLSHCLLAIVDEINEGGNSTYRHVQMLRELVTAEQREINPKYGRKFVEWNATRWLLFSNHTGALPLSEQDRRFFVVDHDGPVREAAYYKGLYGALEDPQFISSVAKYLELRDIAGFNPGERPPMTKAKQNLIAVTRSDADTTLLDVVERWPVDLITSDELRGLPGLEMLAGSAAGRHAYDRTGLRRLDRQRVFGGPTVIYALRNHDAWKSCSVDQWRAEILRIEDAMKRALFFDDDNLGGTL